MEIFDPNSAAAKNSGIFGFPFHPYESKLVLIPVPWDATMSWKTGSSGAPAAIFEASKYTELFDTDLKNFYEAGIAMESENPDLQVWNNKAKKLARKEAHKDTTDSLCANMSNYVYSRTKEHLQKDKIAGIVGGDHSVALGSIKAYTKRYPKMGVLQIDAHCDLRKAFEGLTYSHASVMYNVLERTDLKKVVQVGVRGFCEEEFSRIQESKGRITTFFDRNMAEKKADGKTWNLICDEIIDHLPREVYISLDIDGLVPSLCPNTGTPVPGGLNFQELIILIKQITESGKVIVGFDLSEVVPIKENDWDANVGSHLLYQLCGWCIKSQTVNN